MKIQWQELLTVALGELRLEPQVFWQLTPWEFAVLSGLASKPTALSRSGLENLMALYPDVGRDSK